VDVGSSFHMTLKNKIEKIEWLIIMANGLSGSQCLIYNALE
jgi:hypothetical protein